MYCDGSLKGRPVTAAQLRVGGILFFTQKTVTKTTHGMQGTHVVFLAVPQTRDHIDRQWPLSGINSITMEVLVQSGEGGGLTPSPFHSIYPLDSSCCVAPSTPSLAKLAKDNYLYSPSCHSPLLCAVYQQRNGRI